MRVLPSGTLSQRVLRDPSTVDRRRLYSTGDRHQFITLSIYLRVQRRGQLQRVARVRLRPLDMLTSKKRWKSKGGGLTTVPVVPWQGPPVVTPPGLDAF